MKLWEPDALGYYEGGCSGISRAIILSDNGRIFARCERCEARMCLFRHFRSEIIGGKVLAADVARLANAIERNLVDVINAYRYRMGVTVLSPERGDMYL